ncbi:MAG TPA: DUF2939 domain-containing protein [Burkholderiaceae bacterium]|nr:DUF2939 domain-containing protein [Burkholderiaceae bacterium]
MRSKALKLGIVAVLVTVAAYWYWSPLVAIHQMREAARSGDADSFNDHVDYPRLRESMKAQLSTALTRKLGSDRQQNNEFAKAGAALGAMLGLPLVDKMVDAFVRPETVMQAMQQGKMMPKRQPEGAPSSPAARHEEKMQWQSERKGVDKYIAYALRPGRPEDERIAIVLERNGFAHWKLTEIRLPAFE